MTVLVGAVLATAGGAVVAGLGACWLRTRWLLVTVRGHSMRPTFEPGDRVLVRRCALDRIRTGDVVLIAPPDRAGAPDPADRRFVKRAVALPGDPVPAGVPVPDAVVPAGCFVALGDNAGASHDSRVVGYFPAASLCGVAPRRSSGAGAGAGAGAAAGAVAGCPTRTR